MSKGFTTTIFLIFLIVFSVGIVILEKNQLRMVEIKVSELDAQKKKIISESDDIWSKINTILAMDKLQRIAEEKNFTKPSQDRIIKIK